MNKKRLYLWLLAAAAILVAGSGCDLGAQRQESARLRMEHQMAEARLTAAHNLLAAGYVEQAQHLLEPYLPRLDQQDQPQDVMVAQKTPVDKAQPRLAKADLPQLTETAQVW